MDRFDFIGNTRAVGLIGAMEFSADPVSRTKFDPAYAQKQGGVKRAVIEWPDDDRGQFDKKDGDDDEKGNIDQSSQDDQ